MTERTSILTNLSRNRNKTKSINTGSFLASWFFKLLIYSEFIWLVLLLPGILVTISAHGLVEFSLFISVVPLGPFTQPFASFSSSGLDALWHGSSSFLSIYLHDVFVSFKGIFSCRFAFFKPLFGSFIRFFGCLKALDYLIFSVFGFYYLKLLKEKKINILLPEQ